MSVTVTACDERNTRWVPALGREVPVAIEVDELGGALFVNWCNENARAVLKLLGLGPELYGDVSIAEARRAVVLARASFGRMAPRLVRAESVVRAPRPNADGTVQLHAVRAWSAGLDEGYLARQVDRFEAFVLEVERLGATRVA